MSTHQDLKLIKSANPVLNHVMMSKTGAKVSVPVIFVTKIEIIYVLIDHTLWAAVAEFLSGIPPIKEMGTK